MTVMSLASQHWQTHAERHFQCKPLSAKNFDANRLIIKPKYCGNFKLQL